MRPCKIFFHRKVLTKVARNGAKNSGLFKKFETSPIGVVFGEQFKNDINFEIKVNFEGVIEPVFQQNLKFLIFPHLNWRQIVVAARNRLRL